MNRHKQSLHNEPESKPLAEPIDHMELQTSAIRQLTKELPLNDFGLPLGIYRTDLLPFHDYDPAPAPAPAPAPHLGSPEVTTTPTPPSVVDARGGVQILHSTMGPPPYGDTSTEFVPQVDPFSILAGEGDGLSDLPLLNAPVSSPQTNGRAPSLVPEEIRIAGFPAKSLQSAYVPLYYDEGFPAFKNGVPFWGRLDYEPADAYLAFQRYLQMPSGRSADPEDSSDYGTAARGIRAISELVTSFLGVRGIDDKQALALMDRYKQYYHLYYWGPRAKSYDLFRITQYRQQQELRAIETQDDHYIQSRKIRARLSQYMESEEEFWELMTPKVAVDMFKTLIQVERISAGVAASGPSGKDGDGERGRSFEVAFRTVAQTHNGATPGSVPGTRTGATMDENGELVQAADAGHNILSKALESPEATRILQEIIIKGMG